MVNSRMHTLPPYNKREVFALLAMTEPQPVETFLDLQLINIDLV